ncbi:UDP-N-acetylmuramoyl-L-alanine--D-glutamate ligase [Phycicoccus endophyticus]|uniref:UDP-N-acetylmuramoylalanine--D-glutamate ligase n=1 Tax=Phycicoccus endophyticus TaxID=1690220 RepID=A0A7G9R547_9MICO|nr:UDP-N-acetylmuramoyl-L-alanine--D-glutamate ligase [Phycicoccus endophyticus]NHI20911.1 UDP-N-acetylmuramoyl-L-alanine--D-glutamate ligase [Phycicoccus endophyticus]QNN50722.1 UDP-N-acetylmuramoyl-L-alanine--D-glutamate ligase [Phycicoccus endophyticus]GGL22006.1 UDP-N-acetylmuramoylalanine--D-glutamate ligase [Phycicoccus endophyticus]
MSAQPARTTTLTHRDADWASLRVLVAGLGLSGFAAADALLERGALVTIVDAVAPAAGTPMAERAHLLDLLGASVHHGPEAVAGLPAAAPDLVVTSPGWRPDQPLLAAAARAGVPVWGEVELAWRMRPREGAAPWLTVTGTNGKTTTVRMLAAMLQAAGLRACSAGNVGTPVLEAVMDPQPYDVIAVELSSFQLHWSHSLAPRASACLNVAPDHVDWHGSFEEYARAKGRVYENTEVACVYNVEDERTRRLVEQAEVQEGCRAVGFTLGVPGPSELGVVDDVLADRAFVAERATTAAELASLEDLGQGPGAPPPHLVANALAAAALARAHGVPAAAVRAGLRGFVPDPHRIAEVGVVRGLRWVDDSKATNPHAARASLAAFEGVVWVAGGLLKGAEVDELVAAAAPRLRGVVLLGRDRSAISEALARHAPDVPVREVARTDTGAMDAVVEHALALGREGDVVLLAPAAASMDMFTDYGARGDAFTAAVRRLTGGG